MRQIIKLKKICGHRISFLNTVSEKMGTFAKFAQMLKSTKIGGRGGGSQIKKHTTAIFTQIMFELYNIIVLLGNIKF